LLGARSSVEGKKYAFIVSQGAPKVNEPMKKGVIPWPHIGVQVTSPGGDHSVFEKVDTPRSSSATNEKKEGVKKKHHQVIVDCNIAEAKCRHLLPREIGGKGVLISIGAGERRLFGSRLCGELDFWDQ